MCGHSYAAAKNGSGACCIGCDSEEACQCSPGSIVVRIQASPTTLHLPSQDPLQRPCTYSIISNSVPKTMKRQPQRGASSRLHARKNLTVAALHVAMLPQEE